MLDELNQLPLGVALSIAAVFGLMVGSFLNVVILRLPKMLENNWRADCCELLEIKEEQAAHGTFNLLLPASRCPKCEHKIRFWENIPVISYLFLKGRCASCKTRISPRYPIIELVTAILSAYTIYYFGFTTQGLVALVFVWSLIALTMIDIDTFLLPDNITLPLLWLGLLANSFELFTSLPSAVYGAAAGYLALWSVYWVFKWATGKEGMGFGDFKLLAALGAWLGWQALPVIVLLSSLVGAVIGIAGILLRGKDKNIPIPFGPYLAIAGLIALFWGEALVEYYKQFMNLQ